MTTDVDSVTGLLYTSSDDDSDEHELVNGKKLCSAYDCGGSFANLSGSTFLQTFRLRRSEAEWVLSLIGCRLKYNMSQKRGNNSKALSPSQQLLLALHWMGNGGHCLETADFNGTSKATVSRTLKRVLNAIVDFLFQDIVKWPDRTTDISADFMEFGGLPFVCGCVDGILISVDAPRDNEAVFVDKDGNHSLNCMMISGPDQSFYFVSARWPGSVRDSKVMQGSFVYERFQSGWRPFSGAVILGDTAYSANEWLITPIYRCPNDPAERRFNRAHLCTRKASIDTAFRILKARFPCLRHLRVKPETAGKIVMACATLHNIARKADFIFTTTQDDYPDDQMPESGTLQPIAEHPNGSAIPIIDELLTYFV